MRAEHCAQKAGNSGVVARRRSFVVWRDLNDVEALTSLLSIGLDPSPRHPGVSDERHRARIEKKAQEWRRQLPLFPGFFPLLTPIDDPSVPDGLDDTLPTGDMPGQLLLDLGFDAE